MSPAPVKSPSVAKLLGISYSHLLSLIRYGKLPPPTKDSSGDYYWSEEHIELARHALARGRKAEVVAQ